MKEFISPSASFKDMMVLLFKCRFFIFFILQAGEWQPLVTIQADLHSNETHKFPAIASFQNGELQPQFYEIGKAAGSACKDSRECFTAFPTECNISHM